MTEARLGKVKHYFGKINVAIIVCEDDGLATGETIHIKGRQSDLTFEVLSMQVEHQALNAVEKGKDVAVKVPGRVRMDDIVYKVKE